MTRLKDALSLSSNEKKIFFFTLLVSLVAKSATLFPLAYSIDDYSFGQMDLGTLHQHHLFSLSQGRYQAVLQNDILYRLGLVTPQASVFWSVTSMLSLALMAVLILRQWGFAENVVAGTLMACVVCVHPFMAENFTLRLGVWTFFFLLFNYVLLYISSFQWKRMLSCAFLIALMFVQQSPSFIFLAALFTAVFAALRAPSELQKSLKETIAPQLVTLVVAAAMHVVINKIVLRLTHVAPGRFSFIGPGDLPTRFAEVAHMLPELFYEERAVSPSALVPELTKLLFLALVAFAVVGVAWRAFTAKQRPLVVLAASMPLVLAVGVCGIFGILWLARDFTATPRVLYAIGVFEAGVLGIAFWVAKSRRATQAVVVLSAVMVLSYVGVNNKIFRDQFRINMRDLHKANRIVMDLERLPAFSSMTTLALVGGYWRYAAPVDTVVGDMNISAYQAPWAKLPMLEESSGYAWSPATSAEDNQAAADYCKAAKQWPAVGSIVIRDRLGIVCL